MTAESLTAARLPPAAGWVERWPAALRLAIFAIAALALRRQLTAIDGAGLLRAFAAFGWQPVALAFLCTCGSFLTLGVVEIIALHAADSGVRVPRRTALVAAFVAHAISQSAGIAILTGAGVRLRAYAGTRLHPAAVARVTAFVTGAIAAGLLSAASLAWLAARSTGRGDGAHLPSWIAVMMLGSIVLAGAVWTITARRSRAADAWLLRRPPPFRTAATLVTLSAFDWLLTATVLFLFLPASLSISYPAFVAAYLVAQAGGMLSHVPAGAGVFEAAVMALLASHASTDVEAGLAAALVAFRVVYYLVPLGVAGAVGGLVESRRAMTATAARRTAPTHAVRDEGVHRRPAGEDLEWLIDNASAYDRMLRAIGAARRSVWMTQLAFDADCVAYATDGGTAAVQALMPQNGTTILAESILDAVARAEVDVRILLNATLLLDTARPLRRFFAARIAGLPDVGGTIHVRGVSCFPQLLHAKMVIVDGEEAFLLGSPFANGYWDDPRHCPVDSRRPSRELGGRPLHDVSLRIAGRPVAQLERIFSELWTHAEEDPSLMSTPPDDGSDDAVRIVCTSPRRVLRRLPDGATRILDAVLEGIARARSLIYIEHQYLSARPIVAALAAALRREPRLELIAVLNQNPDVTAYRGWQNARLAESGLLQHPRAGFFALWTAGPVPTDGGRRPLNQVFVHSKVLAVDDRWATTGSANLDGVSLHSYGDDFSGRIGRRIFRDVRNFDINVVIQDDGPGGSRRRAAAELRTSLWAEHLSMPPDQLVDAPAGGWLTVWRAIAAANVAALGPHRGAAMQGFVLPYSIQPTPASQLADLGVPVDGARLDVRFDPGWLEVHFSPNWVRNMFA